MEEINNLEESSYDEPNNNFDMLNMTAAFENVIREEEIFLWNNLPNELLINNNFDMLDMTAAFENLEPEEEELLWNYLPIELLEETCSWNNLPNELLIHIFLRYLPHSDLQQIRLVCRRWHDITQLPEFMNKSKFMITRENMDSIYTCLINDAELSSRLAYNTLELHNLEESDSLVLILQSLGANIRQLRLCNASIYNIIYILQQLEELFILEIENFTNKVDLSRFKNLKLLNIETSFQNGTVIETLVCNEPMQMKNVCFHLHFNSDESLVHHLQKNASYLKHLVITIKEDTNIALSHWKRVCALFRQLESLTIAGSYDEEWIEAAIECMPRETPLRNLSIVDDAGLTDSLLQQVVHKWKESLENIELLVFDDLTDVGVKELGILRHNLKSLTISRGTKVSHLGLLQGLAKETNNVLENLTLHSIVGMDPMSMGVLAQRLPQLTYLSLGNCGDAIDDSTLKVIFSYQRKLQHLALDECVHITDEGILGFGLHTASIRNLKGLQSLTLIRCSNLSNRTLCGLKFNQLRRFHFGFWNEYTSEGIGELVKNCPALEELFIWNCSMICDDAMLHIAKGLRRLRFLYLYNCTKLTCNSVPHLVEICKSLKQISMYGIDPLAIKEVREKILQLKLQVVLWRCKS